MSWLEAVILGIIQGLTEFLPVSSSGHLTLMHAFFGINEPTLAFDVFLHLGTLCAVCAAFWRDIWALLKKPFQKMTFLLIIGTVPAVIAALLFGSQIEMLYEGKPLLLAGAFVITGIMLILADSIKSEGKNESDLKWFDALFVGGFQALAIPPGVSRSGATITGSMLRGMNRETAAKFAFLLSIPAVLGAAVLQFKDVVTEGSAALGGIPAGQYLIGFLAAALSGYLAVTFMISLIKRAKLKYFSVYVFALAAVVIIFRARFG
jgi:undecaprenyl-diphosphatase